METFITQRDSTTEMRRTHGYLKLDQYEGKLHSWEKYEDVDKYINSDEVSNDNLFTEKYDEFKTLLECLKQFKEDDTVKNIMPFLNRFLKSVDAPKSGGKRRRKKKTRRRKSKKSRKSRRKSKNPAVVAVELVAVVKFNAIFRNLIIIYFLYLIYNKNALKNAIIKRPSNQCHHF